LLGGGDDMDWEGQSVHLTFMTGNGPYETSVRIGTAVSTAPAP
jgi:hypothetical protein